MSEENNNNFSENKTSENPITSQSVETTTEAPKTEVRKDDQFLSPANTNNGNGNKIDLKEFLGKINIVKILIILAIVWGLFYLSNQSSEKDVNNNDEENPIVVSDEQEEGKVNIIEEVNGDIIVSGSAVQPSDPSKTIVTIYLNNIKEDPNMEDCDRVFPLIKETAKRYESSVINTMLALLEPLNEEQKSAGYVSSIPAGTFLRDVKISDSGVATATFFGAIENVGGSCAVTAIRKQIIQTLLQFNSINSVVICINRNCNQDEILQP